MKSDVGLWIDQSKAIIVTMGDKGGEVRQVQSNMEKHFRLPRGSSQVNLVEGMQDQQFGSYLGRYYEGIISLIRGAGSIWIFGPDVAKVQLENCLKREELGGRIVGVDTVKRMTNQQITAKVQSRFQRRW